MVTLTRSKEGSTSDTIDDVVLIAQITDFGFGGTLEVCFDPGNRDWHHPIYVKNSQKIMKHYAAMNRDIIVPARLANGSKEPVYLADQVLRETDFWQAKRLGMALGSDKADADLTRGGKPGGLKMVKTFEILNSKSTDKKLFEEEKRDGNSEDIIQRDLKIVFGDDDDGDAGSWWKNESENDLSSGRMSQTVGSSASSSSSSSAPLTALNGRPTSTSAMEDTEPSIEQSNLSIWEELVSNLQQDNKPSELERDVPGIRGIRIGDVRSVPPGVPIGDVPGVPIWDVRSIPGMQIDDTPGVQLDSDWGIPIGGTPSAPREPKWIDLRSPVSDLSSLKAGIPVVFYDGKPYATPGSNLSSDFVIGDIKITMGNQRLLIIQNKTTGDVLDAPIVFYV